MRSTLAMLLLALSPAAISAQQTRPAPQPLPRDVRLTVIDRWNGANEFRAVDRAEIGASSEVQGDVAVLRGPLLLAGHVTGNVLVINGDLLLSPTAHIEGELLVVGGDVEGRATARVDGSTRIYHQPLAYREEGDKLVALNDQGERETDNWWRRFERDGEANWTQVIRVVQAGAYNRVEGLPVELGPALQRATPWGSVRFDAAAVVRTASTFDSEDGDVGHDVKTEVRVGHDRAIGVGARLFNVVDPIEAWQLSDLETALAAFVARHDYRDYYQRHGANASVTLYGARNLSLSGSFGEERWSSRTARNAFTLFNGDRDWRANPLVDEGLFHVGDLSLKFDTRTDTQNPWSGWFLNADLEHGRGTIASPAPLAAVFAGDRFGPDEYSRGFFDLRRYNRLGPGSQLNLRMILGGWLGGDELPLERRVSVDGPGAIPGFGFRSAHEGIDVGTCGVGSDIVGAPAECDRIALAQVEYRGDLRLDWGGDWEDWTRHYRRAHGDVTWVFFADAGRGWRVGSPDVSGLTYGVSTLPPLSTFRTDIGVGLDVAGVGVYAAKSLSSTKEPANFFVRLRHRF
jgi:hypothetical protein